jgi:hypothetical protein
MKTDRREFLKVMGVGGAGVVTMGPKAMLPNTPSPERQEAIDAHTEVVETRLYAPGIASSFDFQHAEIVEGEADFKEHFTIQIHTQLKQVNLFPKNPHRKFCQVVDIHRALCDVYDSNIMGMWFDEQPTMCITDDIVHFNDGWKWKNDRCKSQIYNKAIWLTLQALPMDANLQKGNILL